MKNRLYDKQFTFKKHLFISLLFTLCLSINSNAQRDVTNLYITNATFSNGTAGWTVNHFNNPNSGYNTIGCATEAYAGWGSFEVTSYSITQTITLPKGFYTLVNYSFFRQGQYPDSNPEKSLAFLKVGEEELAIKTLGSISVGGYANSQHESADVFDSKMYRNFVNFTIDDDNTEIEIGVKGTFDEIRSWCIVGTFELINNDLKATFDTPFDVTWYLTNPSFEYRNMSGWTLSGNGAFDIQQNNSFDKKTGKWYVEKWQPNTQLSNRSMSQLLTNIPNGYYKLSANVYYNGTGAYLMINDTKKYVTANISDKYDVECEVTDGKLKIEAGVQNGTGYWVCFDKFCLEYWGENIQGLFGDVNDDGELSLFDAICIISWLLDENPPVFVEDRADVNKDGRISFSDAVSIIKIIVEGDPEPQAYLTCPDDHHPHMIDLGLPSGTKWACCNVGADKPEAYGGYYAWGETEEKSYYDWSTYIHCDGSESTCYDLGDDIAGTQYDVAHVKWGGSWMMPTKDQNQELIGYCDGVWTTVNGVNGRKFTSRLNGGSIFLPAAGMRFRGYLHYAGSYGEYWSSTQDPSNSNNAYNLYLDSKAAGWYFSNSRDFGFSVRPVSK